MDHDLITLISLIAVVAAIAVAVIVVIRRREHQRSMALREHFGPEYDRALAQHGTAARAERELEARRKRMNDVEIRLLTQEQAQRFGVQWAEVQQRFVDDPSGAVSEADSLVKEVMRTRGYPMGNFDQRVADLSVEHANVVDHYRAARTLAQAREQGTAGTEEMRQAMVHYRALFTDLLETSNTRTPRRDERITGVPAQRISHA